VRTIRKSEVHIPYGPHGPDFELFNLNLRILLRGRCIMGFITHYQNRAWLSYLCRGLDSILVQFMWHLWRKKYLDRAFLKVPRPFPFSFTIPMLHTGIFLI